MKQKLEVLNNLGCHYIINSTISESAVSKKVSADLFVNAVAYPVNIEFTLGGTGYVYVDEPDAIKAIETLMNDNKEKISALRKRKILIYALELVIFVECMRNLFLTIGYQLYCKQFDLARTCIALVCMGILFGMLRINLILKYQNITG